MSPTPLYSKVKASKVDVAEAKNIDALSSGHPSNVSEFDPVLYFKCLADDTRLRCLLLICHEDELCVCELTAALGQSQPKISRHLAQLRKSGLLSDRRAGQWVYYALNKTLPAWALENIQQTKAANQSFIEPNLQALSAMGDRPSRCCD